MSEILKAYKEPPNINDLKDIAIFLEGIKQGKGNIQPLGFIQLESLWDIYKELKIHGLPSNKKVGG